MHSSTPSGKYSRQRLGGLPGWAAVGPGLGLPNVLWGAGEGTALVAASLVALVAGGAALTAWKLPPLDAAALAAALLVGLWFLPAVSAHAVTVPLALLGLAIAAPHPGGVSAPSPAPSSP